MNQRKTKKELFVDALRAGADALMERHNLDIESYGGPEGDHHRDPKRAELLRDEATRLEAERV